MDSLEQVTRNYEAVGFVRKPVITADPGAKRRGDIEAFAESIRVKDELLFVKTFPNENPKRSFQINGSFNKGTGEYLLYLCNAKSHEFDYRHMLLASEKAKLFGDYEITRKVLERDAANLMNRLRGSLEISEEVKIDGVDAVIKLKPLISIRGLDLGDIYKKFASALEKLGYKATNNLQPQD